VQARTIHISDELLLRARAGDAAALADLWDTCTPLVRQIIHAQPFEPGPALDADDLAQETARIFLEAVRRAPPMTGTAFTAYLSRHLSNQLRSFLRAERRRRSRQVLADEPTLERTLQRRQSSRPPDSPPGRQIARALERLSPRQRAVIAGLYFRDLRTREVASELGLSRQEVNALHRRALATLRAVLRADDLPAEGSEAGS